MRLAGLFGFLLVSSTALTGCVGFVAEPGYVGPVIVAPPPVEVGVFGVVGGHEEHDWGRRGARSRGWRR